MGPCSIIETMKNNVPAEEDEEAALADYCELKGYNHWHVPNETYTTSWRQKQKNRRLGVKSGVSDHWVRAKLDKTECLFVFEMKRKEGNTPTDEQIEFLLNMTGVEDIYACCCYGADEAIRVLEEAVKGDIRTYLSLTERMLALEEKRKKSRKNKEKLKKTELPY